MAGRHRTGRPVWQLLAAQRGRRPVRVADARTGVEHLVGESAAEHRHAGRYLALCGARVLAASLMVAGRRRCSSCARGAA